MFFVIFGAPASVFADTTTVINNVSTSASTGGGKARAEVKVYTELDGEVVEDIEKIVEFDTGSVDIKVESINKTGDTGEVTSESKVQVNGVEIKKESLETNEVSLVKKIINYVLSFFKF